MTIQQYRFFLQYNITLQYPQVLKCEINSHFNRRRFKIVLDAEKCARRINFYQRSLRRAELIKPSVRSFVRSDPHNGRRTDGKRRERRYGRSAIRTNPLFQCNYFYASRELLSMTASAAGGGGGGDETRRRHRCVGPAERRHWFHREETRR